MCGPTRRVPRQSFGKYEVLARLATGGAANIFLARRSGAAGFNKLVCLKTLLPERANDADFVRMFLDEARLAARLHHPNCVQIYDLGRVDGVYYISMEYIFGETLWNLLTTVTRLKTPLPPTHVAAIVAHVCDGLHHAHELTDEQGKALNLVHRDVSPQNVMISFEGQTKVVDFGIAKAETDRPPTVAGIVKGKFSYMSPEQITGNAVDRRSDIYSLGIVMFECLASRRLYRGDTPEEIARLILEHRAPRLRDVVPDIPQPLDDICARALSRQASRRYQSAAEMGAAIREYLESVRFNAGATIVGRLMAERFGELVPKRRQAYEAAMTGDYDEGFLCEALSAQPVRKIDLVSNEAKAAADEAEGAARMVVPPAMAQTPPALDGDDDSGHGRKLPERAASTADPQVSMRLVQSSGRFASAAVVARTSGNSARTQVDPAEEEAATATNGGDRVIGRAKVGASDLRIPVDIDEAETSAIESGGPSGSRGSRPSALRERSGSVSVRPVTGSRPWGALGPPTVEDTDFSPSGDNPVDVRIFAESTPLDDGAGRLSVHPDPARAIVQRLSQLPEPADMTATVHEFGDEAPTRNPNASSSMSATAMPVSASAAVISLHQVSEPEFGDLSSLEGEEETPELNGEQLPGAVQTADSDLSAETELSLKRDPAPFRPLASRRLSIPPPPPEEASGFEDDPFPAPAIKMDEAAAIPPIVSGAAGGPIVRPARLEPSPAPSSSMGDALGPTEDPTQAEPSGPSAGGIGSRAGASSAAVTVTPLPAVRPARVSPMSSAGLGPLVAGRSKVRARPSAGPTSGPRVVARPSRVAQATVPVSVGVGRAPAPPTEGANRYPLSVVVAALFGGVLIGMVVALGPRLRDVWSGRSADAPGRVIEVPVAPIRSSEPREPGAPSPAALSDRRIEPAAVVPGDDEPELGRAPSPTTAAPGLDDGDEPKAERSTSGRAKKRRRRRRQQQ